MTFDYEDAGLDEGIWSLCAALESIPDIEIVSSLKGVSARSLGSYSIMIAAWSLEALNVLRHIVGDDGTRCCVCLNPYTPGEESEMDDPFVYFDLISGPDPTASELAEKIRAYLSHA